MTRWTGRRGASTLGALVLGLLGALIVAVSVFADGPWTERRFLILAIIAGYGCVGFLTGWLSASWHTALWLSLPALPVLILFGDEMTFALVYFALIAGCATLGAGAGVWARGQRRPTRS